jgi:hypothetical protein
MVPVNKEVTGSEPPRKANINSDAFMVSKKGKLIVLTKSIYELVASSECKKFAMTVLSTVAIEILKGAEEVILIADADDRTEAWGELLDELGVNPEIMV